jgi:uncharacterized delta-60 repeat protein
MKKYFTGLLVALFAVLLVAGCGKQSGPLPEVLTIEGRLPALDASNVVSGETFSITFKFPIEKKDLSLGDLFSSFGPGHTAGSPDLSSATLSWTPHQHTATIEGIKGWSDYGKGTGPGIVEVLAPEGKIKDIFGNELRAGNVLWQYSMPIILEGGLDPTFGTGGVVLDDSGGVDIANSVAVDSSGKIVTAGYFKNGLVYSLAVWRYNPDGTPDTGFGTNGKVFYDPGVSCYGQAVTIDSSDNVLVAGYKSTSIMTSEAIILKYGRDGSLATSFGTNGIAGYTGSNLSRFYALTIDSSGKILAAGFASAGPFSGDLLTCRYNPDGSLDAGFASNGAAQFSGGGYQRTGYSIQTDAAGNILIAGSRNSGGMGTIHDMAIWKYGSDGTPDAGFGTDGEVTFDRSGATESGRSLCIDSLGRIVVGGTSDDGAEDYLALWRYSSSGNLDSSFGTNGQVLYDGDRYEYTGTVLTDSEGRILLAGYISYILNRDMVVLRYTEEGILDTEFANNGIYIYDSGNDDRGHSMALDNDGKIMVAGWSYVGALSDMAIWRIR